MNGINIRKSVFLATLAFLMLLAIYFSVLTLVSGSEYSRGQFSRYWYFVLLLALGFGVQIGLYSYLKNFIKYSRAESGTVAVLGTTSTVSMISCCSHYLANILPIIGTSGIAAFAGVYQVELFWLGILLNLVGIAFISLRLNKVLKVHLKTT
ncbi:MAG: hypothetical protein WC705_03210 [Candidatus Paceibacterota bacterium]|jgi:Cu+-exporting ATPase